MALREGVADRIVLKKYASALMTSGTLATSSSDLGATGGNIIRRVASTLNFQKDNYRTNEVQSHRQVTDFRHGPGRVTGGISGELSCGTYFDVIEAAFTGTRVSALAKSNTELTSVAADSTTSTFTFGGGAPVTEGFRVGMAIQFTNLSEALNNSKNYYITGFSGASNRVVAVYPAPTTMAADSAFNVVSLGKSVMIPETGQVRTKWAAEVYNTSLDKAELFTEMRVGGFGWNIPASGMVTTNIPFMGRYIETYEAGTAPFFSGPTAENSNGVEAAVNGVLMVQGIKIGVCTGLSINLNNNLTAPVVQGQNFPPEIFLGRADITGQATFFFEDFTLFNYFLNETEVSLLSVLTSGSGNAPQAQTILLPRLKFGAHDKPSQGEQEQGISMPFQALLSSAAEATAGVPKTSIQVVDSTIT